MNIMDLFKPAAKAADTNQNNQGQNQNNQNAGKTDDVTKANADAAAANANKDPNNPAKSAENPLDVYAKLFQNASANSEIQAPSFNIDPKIIGDVAAKMDFTQGINPEIVQKANGGDAAAMMQLIQAVGQNSYRAALEHATKLTDTHLGQRSEFESKRLQKGVKDQLTSDALTNQDNANTSHPLVKAELNRVAKQFAASPEYADATPAEIAKAAYNYMNDLHKALNPADPSKTKEGKAKPAEVDYVKYLGFDNS